MFNISKFRSVAEEVRGLARDRTATMERETDYRNQKVAVLADLAGSREAHEVFKQVSQSVMIDVQERVAHLVTLGLKTVFPDAPEFVVDMVLRRDALECDLLFKQGDELYKPVDASGGGLLDVASFSLRVAYWSLKRTAPVFILDEPFKFVSPDLQPRVESLLRLFCEELGVQIIMVSHSEHTYEESERDRVFVFNKTEGIATVRGE